jgi:hypothetical protein
VGAAADAWGVVSVAVPKTIMRMLMTIPRCNAFFKMQLSNHIPHEPVLGTLCLFAFVASHLGEFKSREHLEK